MTHNQINYWNLKETNRHNVVTENETGRHNRATESIDLGKLNESIRHNKRTEGQTDVSLDIEAGKLNESIRHNQATEGLKGVELSEINRHNVATENLQGSDLNIKSDTLQETNRHNIAQESIDRSRTEAQNALDSAKKEYQDIVNTWEGLQRSVNVELSSTQKDQARIMINKINTEINRLQQQIDWNNYDKAIEGINTLNNLLRTGSSYIDALIPG